MATKEQIVKAQSELPDDADYEEAMDRLLLLYETERRLLQVSEGKIVNQEEAVALTFRGPA